MVSLFPVQHGAAVLPAFSYLLVKGPYPQEGPLHLILSSIEERNLGKRGTARAIFLTSQSRLELSASLDGQNNGWGTGIAAGLADQVQIFYPPTAAHMALLLSVLQVFEDEHPPANPSPYVLRKPGPELIVLHEVSAYYSSGSHPSSSYLSLVTRAILLASRLGSRLVIFDASIDHLRMPVIKPMHHSEPDDPRMQDLAPLMEHYIEWTAIFTEEEGMSDGGIGRRTYRLVRSSELRHAAGDVTAEQAAAS